MSDDLQHHLPIAIGIIREMAQASGGTPPSFREYSAAINGRTFHPEWFRKYHGITYGDLVRRAGYTPQKSGPKMVGPNSYAERRRAEAETAAYIDRTRAQRLRQSPWQQEWPLACVPSSARQEVREVVRPDGSVVRIVRTIASLR